MGILISVYIIIGLATAMHIKLSDNRRFSFWNECYFAIVTTIIWPILWATKLLNKL